jgi:hypothetical protein
MGSSSRCGTERAWLTRSCFSPPRRLFAPGPEDQLPWSRGGPAGLAPPVGAPDQAAPNASTAGGLLVGLVVTHLGLHVTFETFGSVVAVVALAMAVEAWRTRPAAGAQPRVNSGSQRVSW